MSKRRCLCLRSYLIALITGVALYAAIPYGIRQFEKYQHRLLVEKILNAIEQQGERETPTAGKALQQAAEEMELT
jgi:hypothetical protein